MVTEKVSRPNQPLFGPNSAFVKPAIEKKKKELFLAVSVWGGGLILDSPHNLSIACSLS